MKQEHPGREAQESPGFSRGEEVNDWTTCRVTPEMLAELRRLLDAGTPVPWAQGDPAFGGRKLAPEQGVKPRPSAPNRQEKRAA